MTCASIDDTGLLAVEEGACHVAEEGAYRIVEVDRVVQPDLEAVVDHGAVEAGLEEEEACHIGVGVDQAEAFHIAVAAVEQELAHTVAVVHRLEAHCLGQAVA